MNDLTPSHIGAPYEMEHVEIRQDLGGPYPRYKTVTLILLSDGTVRWTRVEQ